MGYLHIDNLYKNQEILEFKRCYAMEKIHGTSAHIAWNAQEHGNSLRFFSGGEKYDNFVKLFDVDALKARFTELGLPNVVIYGEAYGGKCQGMSKTYGPNLKFIAFDVKIGDNWLSVPQADEFVKGFGLDFVYYIEVSTDIDALNAERDRPSTQAIRNGMGNDLISEGVVLRPVLELTKNNGSRIIVKHKRDEFRETKTPRPIDEAKVKVLHESKAIAEEWVTPMRLAHVLDKIPGGASMEKMRDIIHAMQEDIKREGEGEIVWSDTVAKAVGSKTAAMTKEYFQNQLAKVTT